MRNDSANEESINMGSYASFMANQFSNSFTERIIPRVWKRVYIPDNKVHGANMGLTWVLSAPDGPHIGPMNLAIWGPKIN